MKFLINLKGCWHAFGIEFSSLLLCVLRGLAMYKSSFLCVFLQWLLSVDLFTKNKHIIILSSNWWMFFGRVVGTTFSTIVSANVFQKWVNQKWLYIYIYINMIRRVSKLQMDTMHWTCANMFKKRPQNELPPKCFFWCFLRVWVPGCPRVVPRTLPGGKKRPQSSKKWSQSSQSKQTSTTDLRKRVRESVLKVIWLGGKT